MATASEGSRDECKRSIVILLSINRWRVPYYIERRKARYVVGRPGTSLMLDHELIEKKY